MALGIGATTADLHAGRSGAASDAAGEGARTSSCRSRSDGSLYGSNWGDGSELSYPVLPGAARPQSGLLPACFGRFAYGMHLGSAGRTEAARRRAGVRKLLPDARRRRRPPAGSCSRRRHRVPSAHPVAVLSHGYWQSRFAGDPVGHRQQRRSSTRTPSPSSASRARLRGRRSWAERATSSCR